MTKPWFVYMVRCSDESLYTGITIDIKRRIIEHNEGVIGAKSLRGKRPVTLVYFEKLENQSQAAKRESAIKNWKRENKLKLIERTFTEK